MSVRHRKANLTGHDESKVWNKMGCGCNDRRKALNKVKPGLGDVVKSIIESLIPEIDLTKIGGKIRDSYRN